MKMPYYIGIEEARTVLAEIGIELTPRQIKRAADPDGHGKRKLPFFVDPIERRLKIEKGALLEIYLGCEVRAEREARIKPGTLSNAFDSFNRLRKNDAID